VILTSLQNPRVKAAVRLRDRRHRDREGLCLVEGFAEVSLAVDSGAEVVTLFVETGIRRRPQAAGLLRRCAAAEVIETSPEVFAKLAYREHPDGWLAVVRIPERRLAALDPGPCPLLLVIDGVEKPGNLGAMVRTADAAGVDAIVLSDPGTDPWNPNAVRASKGAVFAVPLAVASAAEAVGWLRERGIAIVAADPGAGTPYTGAPLAEPVAVVVGAEDTGLSAAWREAAAQAVRIPMAGRVNSLNVATSAALLLYEAVRQRGEGGPQRTRR
jgi:TrmH family RNA methyltransferase